MIEWEPPRPRKTRRDKLAPDVKREHHRLAKQRWRAKKRNSVPQTVI